MTVHLAGICTHFHLECFEWLLISFSLHNTRWNRLADVSTIYIPADNGKKNGLPPNAMRHAPKIVLPVTRRLGFGAVVPQSARFHVGLFSH